MFSFPAFSVSSGNKTSSSVDGFLGETVFNIFTRKFTSDLIGNKWSWKLKTALFPHVSNINVNIYIIGCSNPATIFITDKVLI